MPEYNPMVLLEDEFLAMTRRLAELQASLVEGQRAVIDAVVRLVAEVGVLDVRGFDAGEVGEGSESDVG